MRQMPSDRATSDNSPSEWPMCARRWPMQSKNIKKRSRSPRRGSRSYRHRRSCRRRRPSAAEVAEARERAEMSLHQAELQLALINYHLAQTYADPKDPARLASLKKAAQALDAIYQRNRGNVVGLYAHLWHGKVTDVLGDHQTALDIFDEVLVKEPEPFDRGPATGLEPLFAEAERSRLAALAKQKPQDSLAEALVWLRDYRRFRQTEGYQGIALDTTKAMLAKARKAPGPERTKLLGEILQIATDGSKVRSPFQQDLALMRQETLRLSGRGLEASSFEEAAALGDAAAAGAEWQTALDAYAKAIELAEKSNLNNPNAIAAVREAMIRVQVVIARELFNKGLWNECAAMVAQLIRDGDGNIRRQSAAAAQAAALGVAAALNQYVDAPQAQKPTALEKLLQAAKLTEENWPDLPEADDARMARGQAKLVAGEVRGAIAIFERVNPKSERYAAAMHLAGQCYWHLYLTELTNAAPGSQPTAEMIADRDKAITCLRLAIKLLDDRAKTDVTQRSRLFDAALLLGEIYYHGGQMSEAAKIYEPLIEAVGDGKIEASDPRAARVYAGALRAFCALGWVDEASGLSSVLLEKCPDTPAVNDALVEFVRLLSSDHHKADASPRPVATQSLLARTLVGLSQRQELSFGQMMFVGETLGALGMSAEASREFQNILKRTQTDAEFARHAEKGMTRLRTELLKVLRHDGKFDEALRQVEQLIRDNPRALEPLMEKGRILEAWAENDPARFDQAVNHWVTVRMRLQGLRKKPAEYYEVMYHVARCLVREAETSTDPAARADRAKKAEQVLKAALVLSPQLSGPDMVAEYNTLLAKAMVLQGKQPNVGKQVEKKP